MGPGDPGYVPTSAELDRWAAMDAQPFDPFEAEVERRITQLRAQQEAKRRIEQADLARTFVVPPSTLTLADELNIEEPPLQYTVARLHPAGGNTLLAASFKVGKTTLGMNLLRSLVDGEMFLGEHPVMQPEGRVAYWNYEVSDRQFRAWLRKADINAQDQAAVWNLRGWRLPLTEPFVENIAVQWLADRQVTALVVDPFSRAYGGEENDNTEVGRFLEALDVIKRRAGVADLFLVAHLGRGGQEEGEEHARGATRLDDWADVRWIYRKDPRSGLRYFRADGRDVDFAEVRLGYDDGTKRLWIEGGSMSEDRDHAYLVKTVRAVAAEPGIGKTALRDAIGGKANKQVAYIRDAERHGYIRVEEPEKPGLAHRCFITEAGERFLRTEP